MKKLTILIVSLFLFFCMHGQDISIFLIDEHAKLYLTVQLESFKVNKDKIIKVGLSTDEVKSKIGNPRSVMVGFPDYDGNLSSLTPNMSGQLNYTTWFYLFEPIEVTVPVSEYYINGELTTEDNYLDYKDQSEVYYMDGKIISPGMAEGYKITKSPKLKTVQLDKEKTYFKGTGKKVYKLSPLYCVIFDKGTQVVAGTKAYFLQ